MSINAHYGVNKQYWHYIWESGIIRVVHSHMPLYYVLLYMQPAEGVQLYIELIDDDSTGTLNVGSTDELVDRFAVPIAVSLRTSERRNISGTFGFATIDLTFRLSCLPDYIGPKCDVFCTETTKNCTCPPGFTGPFCDTDIDHCAGVNCGENQRCVDGLLNYTCVRVCEPGFTGPECLINIDDCEMIDCNSGTCEDGTNSFTCICSPGFTGEFCEVDINECVGVDCGENQICVDGLLNYTCVCEPGFTGPDCLTTIDDCEEVTCANSGTCVDDIDTFSCICPPAYTGQFCETNANSYQLQVTFHSFINMNGKCAECQARGNGDCCEGSCPHPCQYFFSLCLRPADAPVNMLPDEDHGECSATRTGIQEASAGLRFSDSVFGTENPILFNGTKWVCNIL